MMNMGTGNNNITMTANYSNCSKLRSARYITANYSNYSKGLMHTMVGELLELGMRKRYAAANSSNSPKIDLRKFS